MLVKPLGLPVGSVRALLLLGLAGRAVLDLRSTGTIEAWLGTALIVAAASYFSSRATATGVPARDGSVAAAPPRRHPLGLPAGTIRTLFMVAVAYGAWLWFRDRGEEVARAYVVWILGAFAFGVFMRVVLVRSRPPDVGARYFDHLLALVALTAAGGLVAIALSDGAVQVNDWTQPLLGALAVHYFGAR